MLNKSIAYRLSIYISLAVISVFIAFIFVYFLFNQSLIKENVQNSAISSSAEVISNVNYHVLSTKEVASNLSEQIYYYLEHGHTEDFIGLLLKKYPFINAIHINVDNKDEDIAYHHYYCFNRDDSIHIFKQNERITTCISEQESFEMLVKNEKSDWSEPMFCKRSQNVVIPYYSPIMHAFPGQDSIHVGDVVCELSLYELNKAVNNIDVGKNGYAMLVSKKGDFITHPNPDYILNRNILDVPGNKVKYSKEEVEAFLAKSLTGTAIAYPEFLQYEKSLAYYRPIEASGWIFIYIQPYRELYEPLYLPILQMLFISVLGILIIYLLVTYITNKQIKPLSSVTKQLKRFSSIVGDAENISKNEIQQVSDSLNYMRSWYENYKLSQTEEAQKTKIRKRDIGQASEIQQSFIKTTFPAFPDRTDIDIYGLYKPVRGVSGDLFDYFFIDDEHLVFTIGDVSGKGIPAAFFMSVAQTIIKINANVTSAQKIVEKANNELFTTNQHQFFLTLFLGVLNVKTGKLNYCNAAHTAPYILSTDGALQSLAQSHGLPLGIYADKNYRAANIQLQVGDTIVLYTDGLSEQSDTDNAQYGTDRLERNLKNLAGLNPQELTEKMEKSLSLFAGNAPQTDDISILTLCYKGV